MWYGVYIANMKRLLIVIGGGLLVIITVSLFSISQLNHDSHVDAGKLVKAVTSYAQDLKAQGKQMPQTISLKELIARKLLTDDDVKGFSGMDVNINLSPDANRPHEIFIRVRMPDGKEIHALMDNSVQQTR